MTRSNMCSCWIIKEQTYYSRGPVWHTRTLKPEGQRDWRYMAQPLAALHQSWAQRATLPLPPRKRQLPQLPTQGDILEQMQQVLQARAVPWCPGWAACTWGVMAKHQWQLGDVEVAPGSLQAGVQHPRAGLAARCFTFPVWCLTHLV